MDDLVQRLSEGLHPVTVGGARPSLEDLKMRVEDMGYVFIKFTGTRGGTDLGIKVDKSVSSMRPTDAAQGAGTAHIEGTLILNYTKVRCIADIDLATLNGTGHLVIMQEAYL